MKKLLLIIAVLLVGIMSCSKSEKEEKKEVKQEVNVTAAVPVNGESCYEAEILQRMEAIKTEFQPALESGVTVDMDNATQKIGDSWEIEMNKVYKLLLSELPESEKVKLKKEQEEWTKKVKVNIEKSTEEAEGGTISGTLGGNVRVSETEERTLELAKRYDQIHKK